MSNSYFVFGETGESFQITNLQDLINQGETFMKNISATSNDLIIYDNKGNSYNSLKKIEYYQETKYFVYCKRYFKNEIKNFKDNLDKILTPFSFNLSINLNSIPDVDSNMDLLQQNSEYLNYSPDNIKETYNKMMNFFDKFKTIYKEMQINCKICEQIKKNYQCQSEGVENMYKNISNLYVKCLKILNDLKKKEKEFQDNNKNILQLYDESIIKLKSTELHPEIIKLLNKQNRPNCKYLIDIYYHEDDMSLWRNNCVEEENLQIKKMNEKEKQINNFKDKIKLEKSSNMIQLKNDWTFYSEQYEKLLKEKSQIAHSLITDLGTDFSIFKSKLLNMKEIFNSNLYNSNPNYIISINDACDTIKQLNEKYSNITSLRSFQISLEALDEYTNKMKDSIEGFSIKINELFINLSNIKRAIDICIDKLNYLSVKFDDIRKDFVYLLSPNNFLKSYSKTLIEIKRKIIFNHKINQQIEKIKAMITHENYQRDIFLKENEKNVTNDFKKIFNFESKFEFKYDCPKKNFDLPNIFLEGEKEEMLKSYNLDLNENIIQSLISQANDSNLSLKYKEKEIQNYYNKFEDQERKINHYLNEMKNVSEKIDEVFENFNNRIKINNQNLEKNKKECESLKKYITSNLNGNTIFNCPLCKERALSGKEYLSQVNYIQEIQSKLDNEIKKSIKVENDYQDLVNQTNIIKKAFMNHMNLIIEKKNIEKYEIKRYYENQFMSMEDLLSSEKNLNRDILSNVSTLQEKNKEFNNNYIILQEENKNLHKLKENYEKNEYILKNELNILQDKYDKLNEDYISMKEELDNKIKDYVISNKNLERTKTEQMETINLLNISHQKAIETLNKKIIKITEEFNLKLKRNQEDYQRLSEIDASFQKYLKENSSLKEQLNYLINELNEKEKTINELMNAQEITNYTNNNSQINYNEEVLSYKKIEKGLRCIFVPYSDGIFICINLSEEDEEIINENQFFNCKYILDLSSFDEELKNLIVENSLIVIGKIGKLNEFSVDKENNIYDLPLNKKFVSVTLDKIDYVIGFPGDEMVFRNYNVRN